MPGFFLWLFEQIGLAALKRWMASKTKPPELQEAEHAVDAKNKEAEALAAPPRSKQSVIDRMRERADS
jgi:hypothetical protein